MTSVNTGRPQDGNGCNPIKSAPANTSANQQQQSRRLEGAPLSPSYMLTKETINKTKMSVPATTVNATGSLQFSRHGTPHRAAAHPVLTASGIGGSGRLTSSKDLATLRASCPSTSVSTGRWVSANAPAITSTCSWDLGILVVDRYSSMNDVVEEVHKGHGHQMPKRKETKAGWF